jgi:hypothetical protein
LSQLLPLLIDNSQHQDEQIRNIVAESIGRLYIVYSMDMHSDIDHCLKSTNSFIRSTIVKSFKHASSKDTDPMQLEIVASDLIQLVKDSDLNVKKNSLESLNAIVHNQPYVIKGDIDNLQKVAFFET